jgi:glycyl-tRNA synthetase
MAAVWRRLFVIGEGYMEISSPNIGVEDVFIASGHVSQFVDPIVSCKECGEAYRADHLLTELGMETDGLTFQELEKELQVKKVKCPSCGGSLSDINPFNLMFKTSIGAGDRAGFLRPETAQNIFILFNRLYEFYRKKLPFGVSQIGRAYRNEISPRQGLLRLREFSQAEVEIFVDPRDKEHHRRFSEVSKVRLKLFPGDGKIITLSAQEMVKEGVVAHQFLAYHLVRTFQFLLEVGIPKEKIRFRQHKQTEMAHYACDCWDAEVLTSGFGWVEVVGIADRTDFDLRSHIDESGEDLAAFVRFQEPKEVEKVIVEPDLKKLGPLYKDKASVVGDLIKNYPAQKIKIDGSIDLLVEGEKINIKKDMFEVKTLRERVEGEKIIPHVIEPSFGIDRIIYCALESAYNEEVRSGEKRVVLKLNSSIAPYDVAVFSLVSKDGLDEKAIEVHEMLREKGYLSYYDSSGTIGRRYARADEIGIPLAVTVDFQTLEDQTVTLRDRDTMKQQRLVIKELPEALKRDF